VETHGRPPQHGEDRDIFERLYAVRLDRLRAIPEARALLAPMDAPGLLDLPAAAIGSADELDDESLLADLGVASQDESDITRLRHVPTYAERAAAEEIANRTRCEDFDAFKPLFEKVQRELK